VAIRGDLDSHYLKCETRETLDEVTAECIWTIPHAGKWIDTVRVSVPIDINDLPQMPLGRSYLSITPNKITQREEIRKNREN